MTSTETHTPLEMLTLLQTVSSLFSDPLSFARISDSMKSNTLIQQSESFEPTRLEPDSLLDLYMRLMKEEIKLEAQGSSKSANEKDGQPNPRKRKLSSPLLQTLEEASHHAHLLPPLLNRLYFRYRDHAIKAIEDEERKYRLLQRDIQEINRGEWDARLQHQEISSKRDHNGVTSIHTILRHDTDAEKLRSEDLRSIAKSPLVQPARTLVLTPRQSTISEEKESEHHKVTAKLSGNGSVLPKYIVSEEPSQTKALDSPASSQVPETSIRSPDVVPTEAQQFPNIPDHSTQLQSIPQENHLPSVPARQQQIPAYAASSPKLDITSRRLPYPSNPSQAVTAPSPSPRLNQTALASQDRSSQSPIILPPLPGMLRPPSGSPKGPLDTLADMAGQQFRPGSTIPSPRAAQSSGGQSHIQLPQPRNYPHAVYPYYDTQPSFGVAYQQYGQGNVPPYHPPNQAGGPIYHVPAPAPGRGQIYSNIPHYQSPSPSYSQYPAYPQSPSYYQTPFQPQINRAQGPQLPNQPSNQRTPIPDSAGRHWPLRPSPIDTSVSSTKWKNVDVSGSIKYPGSPKRPGPDEISPISEKAPSPVPEPRRAQGSTRYRSRGRRARGGSFRGNSSRGRGARAASAASSTVAGSLQSQQESQQESVASEAVDDELPTVKPNKPRISKVKPEPPATPARDEDVSVTETTADESSRKSTRRRRETLRGIEMTEPSRTGTKRKRDRPQETEVPSSPSFPAHKANHILGSRNFPRTSATIMNDISAHKLASMFAKPLTEREAPGYKDLIYRPQDLKSIKSAIGAGSKALAAATTDNFSTSDVTSPGPMGQGTPNSKGASTSWVPATPDVVPPKGIVNSAQLEKELMRMFANAVMFNPDPKRGVGPAFRDRAARRRRVDDDDVGETGMDVADGEEDEPAEPQQEEEEGGVVRDTREMFEAVERSVTAWRAAERAVEDFGLRERGKEDEDDDLDVDELAVEVEEESLGKRRRRW